MVEENVRSRGHTPSPILCSQELPALLCQQWWGEEKFILVVPRTKTEMVIDLAHTPHGRTSGSKKYDPTESCPTSQ